MRYIFAIITGIAIGYVTADVIKQRRAVDAADANVNTCLALVTKSRQKQVRVFDLLDRADGCVHACLAQAQVQNYSNGPIERGGRD